MKIKLSRLINKFDEQVDIATKVTFNEDYLNKTEIRSISEIEVVGSIRTTGDDLYTLTLDIKGEMILPCAITLEDVTFPFRTSINEILTENDTEEENHIKIIEHSIDIMPIIWQNIVMEIPLKVVSPKVNHMKKEGDGWRLMTDEERNREMISNKREE